MRRSNFLSDNLELGKLQQQLLGARITELYGRLGILARTFYSYHLSNTKALMLNPTSFMQITDTRVCCQWSRCYSLMQTFEVGAKGVNRLLRTSGSNGSRLGIGLELGSHRPRLLHPLRSLALIARVFLLYPPVLPVP